METAISSLEKLEKLDVKVILDSVGHRVDGCIAALSDIPEIEDEEDFSQLKATIVSSNSKLKEIIQDRKKITVWLDAVKKECMRPEKELSTSIEKSKRKLEQYLNREDQSDVVLGDEEFKWTDFSYLMYEYEKDLVTQTPGIVLESIHDAVNLGNTFLTPDKTVIGKIVQFHAEYIGYVDLDAADLKGRLSTSGFSEKKIIDRVAEFVEGMITSILGDRREVAVFIEKYAALLPASRNRYDEAIEKNCKAYVDSSTYCKDLDQVLIDDCLLDDVDQIEGYFDRLLETRSCMTLKNAFNEQYHVDVENVDAIVESIKWFIAEFGDAGFKEVVASLGKVFEAVRTKHVSIDGVRIKRERKLNLRV
jgi:hypothetical protein